jgi:hypothetical protein
MQSGTSYFAELTIGEAREHPLAHQNKASTLIWFWQKVFEKHRAIGSSSSRCRITETPSSKLNIVSWTR